MVAQDLGDLIPGQIAQSRSDLLESIVVGGKDGEITSGVENIDEIDRLQRSGQGSQVAGNSGGRDFSWKGQDGIDNVSDPTGEVEILRRPGRASATYIGTHR